MIEWGRRKNGQPYPKRSYSRRPSSDDLDPTDPENNPFNKKYNQERQVQFAAEVLKKWNKAHEKPKNLKLEHAKMFLKSLVPWLASFDITTATLYGTWKFGRYGYNFASKVYREYKTTGSYEKALLKAAQNELDQNIIPKLKSISIKNVSELAAKNLWLNFKKENSHLKIPAKWDKHAEDAMAETLEQVIGAVV